MNLLCSAGIALVLGSLVNANLQREYRPGDYVESEGAYFAAEVEDDAGKIKAHKLLTPSDPKYPTQKEHSHGTSMIGDIESVWNSYTGKGTTVAIIDDGFDYDHPEYTRSDGSSAILSSSRNYYYSETAERVYYQEYSNSPSCIAEDWEIDEEDPRYTGWATHGTNTSTTAAAPMNNVGGVGIAPDADILALKIDFSFAAINEAILYAVSQGVDVINMSIGAYADDSFTDGFGDLQEGWESVATYLNSACKAAYDAGIIVVAAAGNEATSHKSYPACSTKVIGVGALEDNDPNTLAAFTNYVGNQTGELNVDILAPGYVYTATQGGASKNSHTHIYDDTQGTSFSSPIVAGAACLWKEKNPEGTPDEFLAELQSTASDIGAYKSKYVPVNLWYSNLHSVGPSNIEAGRLNVGGLLDIDSPYIDVVQSSINLAVGEKTQIRIRTSNGAVTYSSANEAIATVDSDGKVTGVSQGATDINVTATKNGETTVATIPVKVNPQVAATSIEFSPSSVTLNIGDEYDAEATLSVEPEDASRIFLFESSDESVATVDEDTGLVTAVGEGTCTIDAIAGYGDGYDQLIVTVENNAQANGTITFGQQTGSLNVNATEVQGKDSVGNSWTITTAGTTSFTASDSYSQIGSSKSPASSITFSMSMASSAKFSDVTASLGGFNGTAGNVSIKVGETVIGSGSLSESSDVNVSSNKSAIGTSLTISITDISKGVKAYSISYSYQGAAPEPVATVTSVTVAPAELALDVYSNPSANLAVMVSGTNNPAQTVNWSSSNNEVATVSNSGVVTAIKAGSATIFATSTVDSSKSGSCSVTVSDSTPVTLSSISITGYKTSFFVGDAFSFGGTVTANFSNGTNEDVTAQATFSGYNMGAAGKYTITVSYTYGETTKTATYAISVIIEGTGTVEYKVAAKDAAAISSGDAPLGSSITFANSGSNNNDQMTSGNTEKWTLKGYSGYTITGLRADLKRNSSSGCGTISLTNGGDDVTLKKASFAKADLDSSYKFYSLIGGDSSFECAGDLVLTLKSSENSFWCDKIEVSYEKIDLSDKIIDRLSVSYTGGSIFIGGELDASKVTVTAHFTDSEKYPDAVLKSSDYELSGFSSASAGQKNVTATYTGALATSVSPLTTSFEVSVIVDTVASVEATCAKVFHPGDVICKADITLTLTRLSGSEETTSEFEFAQDGYRFTYADAPNGTSVSQKQFAVQYAGETYNFSVSVTRVAYVAPNATSLSITAAKMKSAGVSGTGATAAKDYDSLTVDGIKLAATHVYIYNTTNISFGKEEGEIHNTSPLSSSITSLSLGTKLNNARTDEKLYVSTDGVNYVLVENANFNENDYRYFKVAYESASSYYSNFASINLTLVGADNAVNVANYIMAADEENQCLTKLDMAVRKLNTMSTAEKELFWLSEDYVIATARTRLAAWATSRKAELTYSGGSYGVSIFNGIGVLPAEETSNAGAVVISVGSAIVVVGFLVFIIAKRRTNSSINY